MDATERDALPPIGERRSIGELVIEQEPGGFRLNGPGQPVTRVEEADVEELCRYDDQGRYRPLTGARSLPRGWFVDGLDRDGLCRLIDAIYPQALLWYEESTARGATAVATDGDVLGRQTGRYAVAADLSAAGRRAAREVLCDRVCVREPVWSGDPPLPIDGAAAPRVLEDGSLGIPCPEPCSVFVSLCREAALWEKSRPGPVEVEEHLPFAAFDVPGNEVREEYLRLRFESSVSGDG